MSLIDRIRKVRDRCAQVERELADTATSSDTKKMADLGREFSKLGPVVQRIDQVDRLRREIADLREIQSSDREMLDLARDEIAKKEQQYAQLEKVLLADILPKDPNDSKNVILEIRAGTGGEEAALFAAELYRMYTRYAERRNWKTEILAMSSTGICGMKEAVMSITGDGIYSVLKHESGVHRVQRVPVTESSGRLHTSAASVAVLPEAEEVDINIRDEDIRVDVFRSGGHGGQSVNTTDSAVRITRAPSGLVVTCQDEKSQLKNKNKAMKVLRARLYDFERQKSDAARSAQRKQQVGTGDRSERIRTYNFQQNRVTDHRVNVTLHCLGDVLDGNIDGLFVPLMDAEIEEKLKDETRS